MNLPDSSSISHGARARRPRAARACDLCRAKKYKCDEAWPCAYCKSRNVECVYKGQDMSRLRLTQGYVRQLEDKVKHLSSLVEAHESTSTEAPRGCQIASPPEASPLNPVSGKHRHGSMGTPPIPSSTSPWPVGEPELSGVNSHTRDVEFYGSSSSVVLLSHAQRTGHQPGDDQDALLSTLHNPAFGPAESQRAHRGQRRVDHSESSNWYPQCRAFIETFFSTIHYVHPILEKRSFLERCGELWSGRASDDERSSSFIGLYYSVLSLGALVGVRDDEPVDGIDNLHWSRKFFELAKDRCNQLGMVTDLEMVQCYFILAKVCQNELHPHLSYMYVGLAVRTALAMGINREPRTSTKKSPALLRAESRTWWGLYSLETEMSFAMGRPDTLGADLYHNRRFPVTEYSQPDDASNPEFLEHSSCAIIECMVDFSRITRNICLSIYLPDATVPRTVILAYQIERDLERWAHGLPEPIRPRPQSDRLLSLKGAKDAQWAKRQRLVLTLRYHNLTILLFGSFLLKSTPQERATISRCPEGVQKCLDSAKQTIDLIYQTYQHSDYFRTWFYNTTYTVFAASIILVYLTQEAIQHEVQQLLRLVDMAIEILTIMDECVVALEAAKLLERAKEKAERRSTATGTTNTEQPLPGSDGGTVHLSHYWGPLNLFDVDMDPNVAFPLLDFDETNPLAALHNSSGALGESDRYHEDVI